MTWSTIMKCLSYKWSRICYKSRRHFLVFSSLMTYHVVCNFSNTTGVTNVAETAYLSGASEVAPVMYMHFWGTSCLCCLLHIFPCLVLCCDVRYDFCIKPMFDFSLALVLSEVRVLIIFNNICILFIDTGVQHAFLFRWCSCVRVTRWMSLMEQELPTLPGHPISFPC